MPLTHQYLRRGLPLAVLGVLLLNGCGPLPTENVSSADCQSIRTTLLKAKNLFRSDPNLLPFKDSNVSAFDVQLSEQIYDMKLVQFFMERPFDNQELRSYILDSDRPLLGILQEVNDESCSSNPEPEVALSTEEQQRIDDRQMQIATAGDPATSVSDLQSLIETNDTQILTAVASNPSTPGPLLELLIGNSQVTVMRALAENPNLSEESLIKLVQTGGLEPARVAVYRTDLSEESEKEIWKAMLNQTLDAVLLNSFETYPSPTFSLPPIWLNLFQDNVVPPWVLERYAENEKSNVRGAIASFCYAPRDLIQKLERDRADLVRKAAQGNLTNEACWGW